MADSPQMIWRNWLTIIGGYLAFISIIFMLSLLFFEIVISSGNPYLGVLTYLVFPTSLVIGIVMIVLGLFIARRRRGGSVGQAVQYFPRIDLNKPNHRRAMMGVGATLLLSLPVIGLLSYNGYHYTESNEFCGKVCHEVMEPEYTAFLDSPHARVGCAECHIGSGASWYVKSKLSGLRQVWKVATNTFSRPIPPAIHELRPAKETCEQCHWPSKFFGDQLRTVHTYSSDEGNSPHEVKLLLKTGGADPSKGPPAGIHWHMALGFSIDYVATDDVLQEIPWVRMKDHATGKETIYRSDGLSSTAPPPPGTNRTIDCMDCHNRPTHVFHAPSVAIDAVLNIQPEFQELPFAKREAVKAMVTDYSTSEEATTGIQTALETFYRQEQTETWSRQYALIKDYIAEVTAAYRANFFPRMSADWRTYPNNIGHMTSAGCFRCHDGKHKDDQGQIIRNDCSICHDFLVPSEGGTETLVRTGGFEHPMPLKGLHATLRCDECHTGGPAPAATCTGCHADVDAFRQGTTPEFASFGIQPDSMARQVDCVACHDLTKPATVEVVSPLCFECHEDDGEEYETMLAAWDKEIQGLMTAAEASGADPAALEALKRSGPLHNFEASKRVLNAITGQHSAPMTTAHE